MMHVVICLKGFLPSKPPHMLIVESKMYKFVRWHRETLVYEYKDTAIRIQTCKKDVKRYVRNIVRSSDGYILTAVDGYRISKI